MSFYILKIITLLGGLALFLFGMDVMGSSLEKLAGGKLQTILAKMSSNVPKGFLLGLAVTAVIQSSSATTVMVVGFVNSGIMTLRQAIGVIMGSNVATTVTAMISTIGTNRGARRTALVHMYFSLVGVALFCIIFYGLGVFIEWEFLKNAATAPDIAIIHTGFNLAATAVLMPMNRLLEKLAYLTIPAEPVHQKPILLDDLLTTVPM